MKIRNDLLAPGAPGNLEVIQLTEGGLPSAHVYMEAQVFTPDSRRFVLHESATAHGGSFAAAIKDGLPDPDRRDPNHRYLLCDLDERCSLRPLAGELGVYAPSVSPDGKYLYYFVDETRINGGRLILKRVTLDGADRQTLFVLDAPLAGTAFRPSRIYPLSTIRSDGKKLAVACFLGTAWDGEEPWGLLVFDLDNPSVELAVSGICWRNMHPQYCRSSGDEHKRDILIQEDHSSKIYDIDIHVVRDDGTLFRNMPWGRDGNERCQGHQCWRGATDWAITGTITRKPDESQLIESKAVAHAGHVGSASPGGIRNDLARSFPSRYYRHFATDRAGKQMVTDTSVFKGSDGGRVFLAELNNPGVDALSSWVCLAHPRSAKAHIHPFLSPDGKAAFFNSDETGILQAYMIRGLETIS